MRGRVHDARARSRDRAAAVATHPRHPVFSGDGQAFRKKDWPQRSKIARAWMVWVALISMGFVPVSYLLAPDFLPLTTLISGLLVPALHACAYLVWRKPAAPRSKACRWCC